MDLPHRSEWPDVVRLTLLDVHATELFGWFAVAALTLAFVLGLGVFFLRHEVSRRTYHLEMELKRGRRMEAALAIRTAAMEHAMEGIARLDTKGLILEVNRAHAQMFGEAEAVRRAMEDFIQEDYRDAFQKACYKALRDGKDLIEVRGLRPDGSAFDLECTIVRTHDAAGRVSGFHVFSSDISEKKEADRANRIAFIRRLDMQRLEETDRFKTRFMNAAAHEINTPLTPLRLQLHLLSSGRLGDLSDRQKRAVDVLDRNLERLSHLVGEMLDVTRLHSGRLHIQPESVPLGAVVERTFATFEGMAEENGIKYTLRSEDIGQVDVDVDRLDQVLFNLLSNALKFTDSGGSVEVNLEDLGDQVAISVRDTGLGLTPDQRDQLFQPFGRLHTDVAPKTPGTGLGLYITKGIVEGHGGTISVESPGAGKGTTFRVVLPRTAVKQRPPRPEGGPAAAKQESGAPAAEAAPAKQAQADR